MKFGNVLFILTLAMVSTAWGRPEVLFSAENEVSLTRSVSLLQLAEIKEVSTGAFQELSSFVLADVVDGKPELTLSGLEISKKIREFVNESNNLKKLNIAFKIPSEIHVKMVNGISKSQTERSLKNVLASRCGVCTYQIRVTSVPVGVKADDFIDFGDEIRNGAFMLPVRTSGQPTGKWITGTIRVQKTVPVAKRLIRFGERVQPEDLEMLESDITYVREETPSLEQVAGLIANKTLAPRNPILLSDLKREPAAKRGQMVKALVGNGEFEVSINATAEEPGFVGDTIKIKNPETQKFLSAVIVDKGVVKIQ